MTISDCYDVSQPTVSRCISRVSRAVASMSHDIIRMPAEHESMQVMEDFSGIGNMPGIIGCIDCTHVVISKPPGEDSERYRNRKGRFSLNVQAVCGPDLKFFNVVARWPGSAHDSNIFDNSHLCVEMEEGRHRGRLLGDAGYPCRNFLFTPLRNPQTDQEHTYNRRHIKTRNSIERAFGVLKRRFACLKGTVTVNLETTTIIIIAAAVLHNLAILGRVPLPEDAENNIEEPQDDIEDHDHGQYINEGLVGNAARLQYIRRYF